MLGIWIILAFTLLYVFFRFWNSSLEVCGVVLVCLQTQIKFECFRFYVYELCTLCDNRK